jgi:3-phenylpropionate/cinnamic acid dioxygenase small subunit
MSFAFASEQSAAFVATVPAAPARAGSGYAEVEDADEHAGSTAVRPGRRPILLSPTLASHAHSPQWGGDLRLAFRLEAARPCRHPHPTDPPTDPPSSSRAIENLIASYAELVDDGDFTGVGILLADATFTGGAGSVSGREAIEKLLRDSVILYDDGTPRTKHVTTNIAIEVDEEAGTAVSRSYFTALQALPDMALQAIVCGRYHDRFERCDGRWRFVERRVRTDLLGDVSRHLRNSGAGRGDASPLARSQPRE